MTNRSELHIRGMTMLPQRVTTRSSQCPNDFSRRIPAREDLGYGDDSPTASSVPLTVTVEDLGYDDTALVGIRDLGYGEEPAPQTRESIRRSSRVPQGARAIQIRNGKRISLTREVGEKGHDCTSDSEGSDDCDSDLSDDYDDISVDYSDDEDEDDAPMHYNVMEDLTELTIDGDHLQDTAAEANPHMPTQVNMEFKGNDSNPRRISLSYSQHCHSGHVKGTCSVRTGCLEVSIGTSRLPRRRSTIDLTCITRNDESRDIIKGLKKNLSNLSVSTRHMRRLSIEHSCHHQERCGGPCGRRNPPTRRVTMNLSSGSVGGLSDCSMHMSARSSVHRRQSMEFSTPTVLLSTQGTRRLSMDMTPASPDGKQRRISMNLFQSQLPRTAPTPYDRRASFCPARGA